MPKGKEPIKVINTEDADAIDPGLENAGWKRDEQLAERTDALEQAAEEASEEQERYGFDPATIDLDNEILSLLDELHVDNAQSGLRYCWCYEGQRGREIVKKRRLGWTVVQSADPECPELKDARGYRVIGDTILMSISEQRALAIDAMEERKRRAREEGVGSGLVELGERYQGKGIKVHADASQVNFGRQGKNLMDVMEGSAKNQGAIQTASKGVDTMLRNGTVPYMPPPGKAGG